VTKRVARAGRGQRTAAPGRPRTRTRNTIQPLPALPARRSARADLVQRKRTALARRAAPVQRTALARWAAPVQRTALARWAAPVQRTALARWVAPARAAPVERPASARWVAPAAGTSPGRRAAPVRPQAPAAGPEGVRARIPARRAGRRACGPGSRSGGRTGQNWGCRTTDTCHRDFPPGAVRPRGACRPREPDSRRYAFRRRRRSRLSPSRDRSDIPPFAVRSLPYRTTVPYRITGAPPTYGVIYHHRLCVGGRFACGNQVSGRAAGGIGAGSWAVPPR
jgi:hypothetical protein